jgi:hypothetical protein
MLLYDFGGDFFLFVSSKNDQFVRSFSIMSQRAYNIPREPKKNN